MKKLAGQGATEYMIVLAVALIVTIVTVSIIVFSTGSVSEEKLAESQIYWRSASPIRIMEMDAMSHPVDQTISFPYLRIKNTGYYPIRITAVLAGNANATEGYCDWASAGYSCGQSCPASAIHVLPSGWCRANITDMYYMAPGQERVFGRSHGYCDPIAGCKMTGLSSEAAIAFGDWWDAADPESRNVVLDYNWNPQTNSYPIQCNIDGTGTISVPDFGFKYIEYIGGITTGVKTQRGKVPLVLGCYPWNASGIPYTP